MAEHAVFLRGINLGSKRRVSNDSLRLMFEELGLGEVRTFRSSGNVVFAAGREPRAELTERIAGGLSDALGWEVAVFMRSSREIQAIAAHEPFDPALVEAAKGKLQVALLSERPGARAEHEALAHSTDQDRLAFGERELYWLPGGGIRDSPLGMAGIESLVGPTTIRTKGTIDQLAAKFWPS